MRAVLRQRLTGNYYYSMIHVAINSIYIVRHIKNNKFLTNGLTH